MKYKMTIIGTTKTAEDIKDIAVATFGDDTIEQIDLTVYTDDDETVGQFRWEKNVEDVKPASSILGRGHSVSD